MMKVEFVDLKAQYESIKSDIDAAIADVIKKSAFIGGEHLKAFEKAFAAYLGAGHCIGVGNGTDALYVAMKTLGIGAGDEVITVANSFISTSEAISQTGAKVVFVDCDERTYNIDPDKVAAAITARTKAIIPVHLYGQPADMEAILRLARRHNLYVIEDAAQAHGATLGGRKAGTLGHMATFSFYPGKNLGAYGDAGAIVTSDDALAKRARMYANHGRIDKYDHEIEGVNSRLDGLQAAILHAKLPHLDRWVEQRRAIAERYDAALSDCLTVPAVAAGARHVYHLYVVRVRNRNSLQGDLARRGIATGIHYPVPLPLLKAYGYLGHRDSDFPVASRLKDQILSLPIHGSMSDAEVAYVIDTVRSLVTERVLLKQVS
jgi:dTDP-4-amino-4,6-dideoxygalactose transaminase